ncbi:hypothetical protein H6P81_018118 [Aristolochia fimbriata]|uniref:Integrase catalytic domain-containing protein n=1 Tax=Aristolochia fimbriata TaxID=158543 RepID=A0AAV7E0G7_ARIFI|nr:hypothetical protein H6P81_018118 [Aristolochia fimbriata]
MKKDTPFEWDESCRRAFQNIKGYLMKPPMLMAPAPGKPLLLYIASQEKSLGTLLARNDDQGKERELYYLIRTMVGAELKYSPIEKTWEEETNLVSVYVIEEEDWRQQFLDYLEHKKLPEELKARAYVRRVAPQFYLFNNTLYRRSYDGILLRCVSKEEGQVILAEAHGGIYGAHQAGPKLHLQVKQLGYYWPTMLRDAMELARHCTTCQLHANYIHQPPIPLHPTMASWPFGARGMDIIGPITPKSSANHQYILAATDYFSKWAEATAYKEVKAATVVDFIRTQIVYRYGVPRYIMTDNGTLFLNKTMDNFCEKFGIQQRTSTAYNPAANGLAEGFNKMLCKILKKTVVGNKKDWHERLGEALWAYRITFCTPT